MVEKRYFPLPSPLTGSMIWLSNKVLSSLDVIAALKFKSAIMSERPKHPTVVYLSYILMMCWIDFGVIWGILSLQIYSMSTFLHQYLLLMSEYLLFYPAYDLYALNDLIRCYLHLITSFLKTAPNIQLWHEYHFWDHCNWHEPKHFWNTMHFRQKYRL